MTRIFLWLIRPSELNLIRTLRKNIKYVPAILIDFFFIKLLIHLFKIFIEQPLCMCESIAKDRKTSVV